MAILVSLMFLAIILPFELGVSASYYTRSSVYFVVIFTINSGFYLVDTILYFFRAYHGKDGLLVLNHGKIARSYLRTWFVPYLLSCIPAQVAYYVSYRKYHHSTHLLMTVTIFDLLKFLRFGRFISGRTTNTLRYKCQLVVNNQLLTLGMYTLLIILITHWIACLWGFVAFLEADGFDERLLTSPNWIGNWVHTNEQGDKLLDPVGNNQVFDRYALCLFWAAQTLTSIGYGNIVPYTALEWWISSVLMLLSGIIWSYMIGVTVTVASQIHGRRDAYHQRIDDTIFLLDQFGESSKHVHSSSTTSPYHLQSNESLKQSFHYFLKKKQTRGLLPTSGANTSLSETFAILDNLPSELRLEAMYRVCMKSMNRITYLSDQSMQHSFQREVASQARLLNCAYGERLFINRNTPDEERAVYVPRLGCGLLRYQTGQHFYLQVVSCGYPFGHHAVIPPQGSKAIPDFIGVTFLTFTELIQFPRVAIMKALSNDTNAWKRHGRWIYLRLALRAWAVNTLSERVSIDLDLDGSVSTYANSDPEVVAPSV